jgi:hypothetical protein
MVIKGAHQVDLKIKFLSLSFCLGAGLFSTITHALPVSVDIQAYSSVIIGDNFYEYSDASASYAYAGVSQGATYSQAYGDSSGHFAIDASSNGHGGNVYHNAHTNYSQKATITNNTGSTQNISFDFLILEGAVKTDMGDSFTGSLDIQAMLDVNILLNGNSIWSTYAHIQTTENGSVLNKFGNDLSGLYTTNGPESFYSWDPQSHTLNLGNFADGQSFVLEYYISATVEALSNDSLHSWGQVSFADPFGLSTSPFDTTTLTLQPASELPEPNGLLLIAGLLALLTVRSKRKA